MRRTLVILALAAAAAAGCFDTSSQGPAPAAKGGRERKPLAEYKDREWVRPPLDAPEWKEQPSGLRVWDVKEGTGDPAPPGGTVVCHYAGWLTDDAGTKFDSSVDRGEPAEFSLGQVIAGWQEGIPGMKPGGIRRLKIPARLAYGDRARPKIPANSTLVFEIELLGGY